jgi:hypothetical protein
MAEPPYEIPSFQVNALIESLVTPIESLRSIGESGTSTMTAPLPTGDVIDSP